MKPALPIAAALLGLSVTPATAVECTGPFRQCAISVQALCSRDANGTQRMTYWDSGGRVIQFERCVGRIFETAGHANPYKTGITTAGNLTVPYTELLYPLVDP